MKRQKSLGTINQEKSKIKSGNDEKTKVTRNQKLVKQKIKENMVCSTQWKQSVIKILINLEAWEPTLGMRQK